MCAYMNNLMILYSVKWFYDDHVSLYFIQRNSQVKFSSYFIHALINQMAREYLPEQYSDFPKIFI